MEINQDAEGAGSGASVSRGSNDGPRQRPNVVVVVDDDERKWSSWLVPILVILNVAVFVVVMLVNDCPKHNRLNVNGKCSPKSFGRVSFQPTRENPLFGPSSSTLKKVGALEWGSVVNRNQGWRLVSCIWLHAGFIHLLVNMLTLSIIGGRLEQQFGYVNIGIILLLSGFGGSVLSSLFIQKSITVGASGAMFGLIGAMLGELLTNWAIYTNKGFTLVTILLMSVMYLIIGIFPHVNNWGHIGGFLTGFLLGFVLLPRPSMEWMTSTSQSVSEKRSFKSKYKIYQFVLGFIALILLILGFLVATALVFRGKNGADNCSWCRRLDCVPSAKWICNA